MPNRNVLYYIVNVVNSFMEKEEIICITKKVTDLKLYFQYNVFVAKFYCYFMYFLKCGLHEMSLATIRS